MESLNLPHYNHKIIIENNKEFILDSIRNKYLLLTPEEWVRQNFLTYLIHEKKYPASLISIEAEIRYHKLRRRYDALLYSKKGKPLMLMEFKSPKVAITQKVFDQIRQYNQHFLVPYMTISNGLKHFCCKHDAIKNTYEFLSEIPEFLQL